MINFVFAADNAPANVNTSASPQITTNIRPFDQVTANTVITINYTAAGSAELASCDTRLEGTSISKEASFSFTPASLDLSFGSYTIVMEATDSDGARSIKVVTFYVVDKMDIDFTYAEDESIVPGEANASASYHEVTPLGYTTGYGATADGTISFDATQLYSDAQQYEMTYYISALDANSKAGIVLSGAIPQNPRWAL